MHIIDVGRNLCLTLAKEMEKYMSNYKNYCENANEMILRDYLALDRTKMANTRTFLSFLRTFVALFGGGFALVKLIPKENFYLYLGYLFMALSLVFLIYGTICYVQNKRKFIILEQISSDATDR